MQPSSDETRVNATEGHTAGTILSFRAAGVPIRFHFTFVIFVIFLIVAGASGQQSAVGSAVYVLSLFGSVLLHELGHAVVSRRYRIRTMEIVMFPIGGLARLERQPKPREELWIALAGPMVNFFIAAVILSVEAGRGALDWSGINTPNDGNLAERIAAGNILLAVFNLLPAFPMDGGRILRSLLALKRPEAEATRVAARMGRYLAIAIGLYGLLSANFILVFIAFFVYLGAMQEGMAAAGKALMQGVPVRDAMITEFHTLPHGASIREAANLLLATSQQDFPVVLGEQVLGLLPRSSLLRAMAQEGPDAYVAGAMERNYVALSPDQDLSESLPALAQARQCALVMEGGRLLGLLTAENLTEYLMLRQVGMPVGGP